MYVSCIGQSFLMASALYMSIQNIFPTEIKIILYIFSIKFLFIVYFLDNMKLTFA